jgi:hypothetical protein
MLIRYTTQPASKCLVLKYTYFIWRLYSQTEQQSYNVKQEKYYRVYKKKMNRFEIALNFATQGTYKVE